MLGTNHIARVSERPQEPSVGLLLSGGLDSAILAAELLKSSRSVVAFYLRTGCVWQDRELVAARSFTRALNRSERLRLIEFELPLGDLYGDHWSMSGERVPNEHTPDEAVFMPGRNPLLLIKPAIWCQQHGITQLALATLENNPFQDATPEFFVGFEQMIRLATGDAIQIIRPFADRSKAEVMQLGKDLPLSLTFSCLAPVQGAHCGRCNKCAERQAAFAFLPTGDPTRYAVQAGAHEARTR